MKKNYNKITTKKEETTAEAEIKDEKVEPEIIGIGKVIRCEALNVRAKPNKESAVIYILPKNENFDVILKIKEWYQIELDSGKKGFVLSVYVEVI